MSHIIPYERRKVKRIHHPLKSGCPPRLISMDIGNTLTLTGIATASGFGVSAVLSVLKGSFLKMSSEQAEKTVLGLAFLYFASIAVASNMSGSLTASHIIDGVANGLISAFAMIFSASGFYTKVQKAEAQLAVEENS